MNSARTLSENLAALLQREHGALADFLIALADFDRRRLWAELGYSSLFYFLHRELRLSKGAAQYRKVAAELMQQVPAVVEPLRAGQLCLTSIIEAAKVVTPENWETLLPRFYALSKREAMEVVAALQPHPAPPMRTIVTSPRPAATMVASAAVPASVLAPADAGANDRTTPAVGWPDEPALVASAAVAVPASRSCQLVPLTAEHDRLHVTVSKRFARKLEEAKAARPGATDEELLEAGLDLLLAQVAKRRGLVERPQKKPRPSKPDHIPAHVRREVWRRDAGRCRWPLASGGICGCTRHLQLDHILPLACGGTSTIDNLRVLCAGHNLEAARRVFGEAFMDRYAGRARKRRGAA